MCVPFVADIPDVLIGNCINNSPHFFAKISSDICYLSIRKVIGGVGKKQKKIHAKENANKKSSCKEEGKEKKIMQKEGPTPGPAILIFNMNKDI